jgi:hypothetical protein
VNVDAERPCQLDTVVETGIDERRRSVIPAGISATVRSR